MSPVKVLAAAALAAASLPLPAQTGVGPTVQVSRAGPERAHEEVYSIVGSKELGGIGEMTNEYIFSMLKRRGVDTKLIQFVDEGHGTTKRANRRFVMQAAIDWVEKYTSGPR